MQSERILIDQDSPTIICRIFRIYSADSSGVCMRSLFARFEYSRDGWNVLFFIKPHAWTDALRCINPSLSVPAGVADLAARALRVLDRIRAMGWQHEFYLDWLALWGETE